jgi:hypothetical protein
MNVENFQPPTTHPTTDEQKDVVDLQVVPPEKPQQSFAAMGLAASVFRVAGYISVGFQAYKIYQKDIYHHEECKETSKAFKTSEQSMNVKLQGVVREDLRDMIRHRSVSLDYMMLLLTLTLQKGGYDFIYNGTLPQNGNTNPYMPLWSGCMALSIIFPFWGVWLIASAKQRLDDFLATVLVEFRKRARNSGKQSYGEQFLAEDVGSMGFYSDLFDDFWTKYCEPLYNSAIVSLKKKTNRLSRLNRVTNITFSP